MEEEKTLTLKSLKKEMDIRISEINTKIDNLVKEIEIIKKVLKR